jgi:replicative DNA helicase
MSDLETKLLSKIVGSADSINRVWEMGLRDHVFEDLVNRVAFGWIIRYWQDSAMALAPTWVVMEHEFPTLKLEKITEGEDLSLEWLVSSLKDRYVLNQAQDILRQAGRSIAEDPIGAIKTLWQQAYDITERTAARTSRNNMAENIDARRAAFAARGADQGSGVPYGLDLVDQHTRGLRPGELAAFAAFTKVGKSFALCKGAASAHLAGIKPIVFTLEMTCSEMEDRIDAFYSGVSYSQIMEGSMLPKDLKRLHEAQERLRDAGDLLVERPERGERTVAYMVNRARQVGAGIMYIDQLSFMDSEQRYTGDQALRFKHGEIMFDLKDEIARESAGAIPCVLAVQQNRDSQKSDGGRGQLQNFANSSFIEQTVDIAFGLWRNDSMRHNNVMGMDTLGFRRGDKQNYLLNWRLHDRTEASVREINEE